MAMPKQKPGKSFQSYGTPANFLNAVRDYLWIKNFAVDLAADASNAVCAKFIDESENSLLANWADILKGRGDWGWLNPPYARIAHWVKKANVESELGAHVLVLIPASTGANWWRDYVHDKARVLLLNGRLTFTGQTAPYPKDCALLIYGPDVNPGYDVWSWNV